MSEKTAKKKRQEQPQEKILHEMRVRVLARSDGAVGIQLNGMPEVFEVAMQLAHDITKTIAQHFINQAAGGELFRKEPSRIVQASVIPKLKH
jgi:hypothetical protein